MWFLPAGYCRPDDASNNSKVSRVKVKIQHYNMISGQIFYRESKGITFFFIGNLGIVSQLYDFTWLSGQILNNISPTTRFP